MHLFRPSWSSAHNVGNNRPYWPGGPAALDTASVSVMDVEKPSPSQGVRWHHQDKECKQFGPGKEVPFFFFTVCAKKLQYPAVPY